jgi:hypothetical protein
MTSQPHLSFPFPLFHFLFCSGPTRAQGELGLPAQHPYKGRAKTLRPQHDLLLVIFFLCNAAASFSSSPRCRASSSRALLQYRCPWPPRAPRPLPFFSSRRLNPCPTTVPSFLLLPCNIAATHLPRTPPPLSHGHHQEDRSHRALLLLHRAPRPPTFCPTPCPCCARIAGRPCPSSCTTGCCRPCPCCILLLPRHRMPPALPSTLRPPVKPAVPPTHSRSAATINRSPEQMNRTAAASSSAKFDHHDASPR